MGASTESAARSDIYLLPLLDTNNSREGPEVPEDIRAARNQLQKVGLCVLEVYPDPQSATCLPVNSTEKTKVCPLIILLAPFLRKCVQKYLK